MASGRSRSRTRQLRAEPLPGDVDDAEGRGRLDRRREGAQRRCPRPDVLHREREARDEQGDHERVVVRAADEREHDERVEQAQHEGVAGVVAEAARRDGHRDGEDGDGEDLEQPEAHERAEQVVAGELDDPAVERQEERAVGGGHVQPDRVDVARKGRRAKRERPETYGFMWRVDHLALGRVAVDVAAEDRRDHEHRQDPQREHPAEPADRRAGVAQSDVGEPDPAADEQDEPAVDERDAEQHRRGVHRGERQDPLRRDAEEPGARELELERRVGERAAGRDGDSAKKPRPRAATGTPTPRTGRLGWLAPRRNTGPRAAGGPPASARDAPVARVGAAGSALGRGSSRLRCGSTGSTAAVRL